MSESSNEPPEATAEPEREKLIAELTAREFVDLLASALRDSRVSGDVSGVHVNSGPPGFVNSGGHANFDPKVAGVHVNSGPPGFVNSGGHANFDPKVPSGDFDGIHVNSGPPGFVNDGGHANFDPGPSHNNNHTNVPGVVLGRDVVRLPDGGLVTLPPTGKVDIVVRGFRIVR
jgi:hypothetical protein